MRRSQPLPVVNQLECDLELEISPSKESTRRPHARQHLSARRLIPLVCGTAVGVVICAGARSWLPSAPAVHAHRHRHRVYGNRTDAVLPVRFPSPRRRSPEPSLDRLAQALSESQSSLGESVRETPLGAVEAGVAAMPSTDNAQRATLRPPGSVTPLKSPPQTLTLTSPTSTRSASPSPRREERALRPAGATAGAELGGPIMCVGLVEQREVQIDAGWVNDDYCDCADGSDEPATAACAGIASPARIGSGAPLASSPARGLRFECIADRHLRLPASRVDDGVCDCCDGSDEPHGAVDCTNICAQLQAQEAEAARLRREGSRLRLEYAARVNRSPELLHQAGMEHAPERVHALAALAGQCFTEAHDAEYAYEVCLFSKAVQRPKAGTAKTAKLGTRWKWIEAGVRGVLRGGDRCPSGVLRSLEVDFECAVAERLAPVREPSTCTYTTTLHTPAVCP